MVWRQSHVLNNARQIITSKSITELSEKFPLIVVGSILLVDISMPRLDGMFLQSITRIYTYPS